MTTKYGFQLSDWNEAKEEMRAVLIERAKVGLPITYSDLVAQVNIIRLAPHSYALATMLGEISSEEEDFGRGDAHGDRGLYGRGHGAGARIL